jgi:hypothetical protein
MFLWLSYLFDFSLRSFFPLSRKSSPLEQTTPVVTSTPIPSKITTANQSYSTFSSPSIQPNSPQSKSFFGSNRKSSKTNIPLLSPPASE